MNFVWNFPKPSKKIINLRQALKNVPSLDPLLREGYNETVKMFPDYEKKKESWFKNFQVSLPTSAFKKTC